MYNVEELVMSLVYILLPMPHRKVQVASMFHSSLHSVEFRFVKLLTKVVYIAWRYVIIASWLFILFTYFFFQMVFINLLMRCLPAMTKGIDEVTADVTVGQNKSSEHKITLQYAG